MVRIAIDVDDRDVLAALNRLARAGGSLLAPMQDIRELLIVRTKERFGRSTAPDGTPWAANSAVTIARYPLKGPKKPLIGESRRLGNEILGRATETEVEVGSNLVQAATQQFGASRGQFGTDARGAPIPWGDIPARPFLGLSDADRADILDILAEHLEDAIAG